MQYVWILVHYVNIVQVQAPWIKHSYLDNWTYIIPCNDYVTVGGTMQQGNWSLDTDDKDKEDIWQRCCELLPSLKVEFLQ